MVTILNILGKILGQIVKMAVSFSPNIEHYDQNASNWKFRKRLCGKHS